MTSELSIFASLHRWARGQDENFCTEGLIHLLQLLLEAAPQQALKIIRYLTSGAIGENGERPGSITVHGQIVSDGKRPDVEIRCGGTLAWIEVKVDSPVSPNQLYNYKTRISRHAERHVVNLLWRGGDPLERENAPDNYLIWTSLADLLEKVASDLPSTVARVLTEDYLRFLKVRSLAMSSISPSIVQSISDVESLIRLIESATGKNVRWTRYHFLGCPVVMKGLTVGWLGFNLTEPQWLFFTTDEHHQNLEMNPTAARELTDQNIGEMVGKHWTMSVDLSAATELFSCDAGAQVAWVRENLINTAAENAARLLGLMT